MGFDLWLYVNCYKGCFMIVLFCVGSSGESGKLDLSPELRACLFPHGLTDVSGLLLIE